MKPAQSRCVHLVMLGSLQWFMLKDNAARADVQKHVSFQRPPSWRISNCSIGQKFLINLDIQKFLNILIITSL
jgi:hypothetical protein